MFTPNRDEPLMVSRSDPQDPLSAGSEYPFELDGRTWPSVEHYYQAMKFEDPALCEQIGSAADAAAAAALAHRYRRRVRGDWAQLRRVMMTRAFYIKCRSYPVVAERLLATGTRPIVENSQYDYFWGCGRDLRGHNYYGRMLMDVREKLRELQAPA